MARDVQAHKTSTVMIKAAPASVYAGSDIALQVRVSCPSKCNLQSGRVRIAADEGTVVQEVELVSFDGVANETDEFVVSAPTKPGEYTWTAVFATQESADILHEESSTPFSFVVKPHTTSMAVWDVPSPIVFNTRFKIKVGVKCCAECALAGREVEIYDHAGAKVVTGALGHIRWSDTGALYWAEVELNAPSAEGDYTWEAKFLNPDPEIPHEGASYPYSFRTARQPEHVVKVNVLDKDTNAPIKQADVILHPYRGYTDERGMAMLMVPKGEYALYVSANEWQTFQTTVKVASDVAISAELLLAPVEDTSG